MIRERHLFGPGPSNPYPEATRALAEPLLGHLDPEFLRVMDETCEMLRTVWGTSNARTLPLSATGSAGMEAAFVNTVHPGDVVVVAVNVELEADGTIKSRDALAWFVQLSAAEATGAQVAETWWNVRSLILGSPHGSRSSLFVNQHTGVHMRKILEAMNASGMFGPIKESSLEMLSQKKRDAISETLIRTAVANWDGESSSFDFELRGETCKASLRDTWNDNHEISVRVEIGRFDLYVTGFYYPEDRRITHVDPRGKRELAEKFL